MGSVTKTIMEGVGDAMQSTSYYFSSFEDFMEYERDVGVMNGGTTAPVSIVIDKLRVETAQAPLTKLELEKQYRITKELYGHGFDIGTVVVIVSDADQYGEYKAELLDGSDYWYIKPDEVEEL